MKLTSAPVSAKPHLTFLHHGVASAPHAVATPSLELAVSLWLCQGRFETLTRTQNKTWS
jgi:hypothetical protein